MAQSCLIIDLSTTGAAADWQQKIVGLDTSLALLVVDTDSALSMIKNGEDVVAVAVFADGPTPQLDSVLRAFSQSVGAVASFQAILCDEPPPELMASVFEFGIEQFLARNDWPNEIAAFCRTVSETLADSSSIEFRTLALQTSVRLADHAKIKEAQAALGDVAEYDYRAAFANAKALEVMGEYDGAVDAFKASRNMNRLYRPAGTGLGEALMVTGRVDEAIEVLEQMDKTNTKNCERKAALASAYASKGDFAKAESYAAQAAELQPDNMKVTEAKTQILLASGKVNEAFELMDKLSDVGPSLAAKLNSMGVKLSQSGKGKSAIALYRKAHKIVRADLKHKVSMNLALACYRMNDFVSALKYLDRCEKEYGSKFEKLDKIRNAVKAAAAKPPAPPNPAAPPAAGGGGAPPAGG